MYSTLDLAAMIDFEKLISADFLMSVRYLTKFSFEPNCGFNSTEPSLCLNLNSGYNFSISVFLFVLIVNQIFYLQQAFFLLLSKGKFLFEINKKLELQNTVLGLV